MTNVNIAVAFLEDAFNDKYDTAFLVTGDSELLPPFIQFTNYFHQKRVFVAFPPNRFNVNMKNVVKGSTTTGRKKLKDAQFPDSVGKKNGFVLTQPQNRQ